MVQEHLFFFAPQICLLVVESRWNLLSLYLDVNQAGRCHGNCWTKKCEQERLMHALRRYLLSATPARLKILPGQGCMAGCSSLLQQGKQAIWAPLSPHISEVQEVAEGGMQMSFGTLIWIQAALWAPIMMPLP